MASTTTRGKTARKPARKWSARVMQKSDALDLESDIFKSGSAEEIARSLKRSAERSKRRKGTPFQSAMSMLNFYINRAGKNLPARKKNTLAKAKNKLREVFGRPIQK
ncbi:MAG TPA: DUF3175 domain-containing protein [Ohtaekwangia sp.]|uniref:DUF3175 domain-containing protein n=1 Tax=Ohtaekwangia sp. TaxID=2066019 RepID=UPI002F93AC1D